MNRFETLVFQFQLAQLHPGDASGRGERAARAERVLPLPGRHRCPAERRLPARSERAALRLEPASAWPSANGCASHGRKYIR
jgi:hypothetical protein